MPEMTRPRAMTRDRIVDCGECDVGFFPIEPGHGLLEIQKCGYCAQVADDEEAGRAVFEAWKSRPATPTNWEPYFDNEVLRFRYKDPDRYQCIDLRGEPGTDGLTGETVDEIHDWWDTCGRYLVVKLRALTHKRFKLTTRTVIEVPIEDLKGLSDYDKKLEIECRVARLVPSARLVVGAKIKEKKLKIIPKLEL